MMIYKEEITVYHFRTKSERIARAMELVAKDQKSCDLILAFADIKKRKKKNFVLRMARYLKGNHEVPHDPQ